MKESPKINQLKNFRSIINYGGVRQAAQTMGQTQPAMTRSINELERILGTRLFERGTAGAVLTETGRAFEIRMNIILNELDRAVDEVKQMEQISHGEVTIGFSHLPAFNIIPALINDFKSRYKDVRITLVEGQFSELASFLRSGLIDFFVGNNSHALSLSDFISEDLMTAKFSVIGRKGHPLRDSTSFIELNNAKWFLPTANFGYFNNIESLIFADGMPLYNSVIYGDSVSVGERLVFEYDYLIVGPTAMIENPAFEGRLEIISIKDKLPDSVYSLIYKKKKLFSPMITELIKEIHSAYISDRDPSIS